MLNTKPHFCCDCMQPCIHIFLKHYKGGHVYRCKISHTGAEPEMQAGFTEGEGRIWLDNVQCTGNERTLINCTASSNGVNSCTHAQDAGVRCLPGKESLKLTRRLMLLFFYIGCDEGNVRLVEGSTVLEGRVEICRNSTWGTICNAGWDSYDARVVCGQLGFSAAGIHNQAHL